MKNIQKLSQEILKKSRELSLKDDLISFLSSNVNPSDTLVHDWATKRGHNIKQTEEEIYKLASIYVKFLIGGRANAKRFTEKDADPNELKMGIKVEAEHIDHFDTQKRIALDHLSESSKYYTGLKKMEKELGIEE